MSKAGQEKLYDIKVSGSTILKLMQGKNVFGDANADSMYGKNIFGDASVDFMEGKNVFRDTNVNSAKGIQLSEHGIAEKINGINKKTSPPAESGNSDAKCLWQYK